MDYNNFMTVLLVKMFLTATKYYSILSMKMYHLYMYILKHTPESYLPIDNNIYIKTDDDIISSEDEEYDSKFDMNNTVINLNTMYFKDIQNIKNAFTILKNNMTRKTILYSELIYKTDTLIHNYEFTKKFKLFYTIDGSININMINKYFDKPFYLFVFFFCFDTNELKYKIFDLRTKTDIIDKRNVMFGKIKI